MNVRSYLAAKTRISKSAVLSVLTVTAVTVVTVVTAACALPEGGTDGRPPGGISDSEAQTQALALMRAGFRARGQATLDRLEQDDAQAECSKLRPGTALPGEIGARITRDNLAAVKYPARLMGDWRQGEAIAQSGRGKQFSDDPALPSGGNCYACHQLAPQEISYGTIGPSLLHFGKLRGSGEAIQRYAYAKIYNAQAFTVCSNMPRFGHNGILTPEQISHLVALLVDPASPVNR